MTGSNTLTYGGIVANNGSGTGALTEVDTGTLLLAGANTYSGTTTISAGTLQIGNGGTTGSLGSGGVTDNGSLIFDLSSSPTVSNTISGSGASRRLAAATPR